jgi:hypothetical protein
LQKQGLEEREEMDDLTSRRRKGGRNVEWSRRGAYNKTQKQ